MADPIVHIPLAGPWRASGSDRAYHALQHNSTIPPLGRVFRNIPFLGPFLRRLRGLAATDAHDYDGPQELEVKDCGAAIVARGLECVRVQDSYEGRREVGGTTHKVSYEVVSPTQLIERWSFGIAKVDIDDKTRAAGESVGIDMSCRSVHQGRERRVDLDVPRPRQRAGSTT